MRSFTDPCCGTLTAHAGRRLYAVCRNRTPHSTAVLSSSLRRMNRILRSRCDSAQRSATASRRRSPALRLYGQPLITCWAVVSSLQHVVQPTSRVQAPARHRRQGPFELLCVDRRSSQPNVCAGPAHPPVRHKGVKFGPSRAVLHVPLKCWRRHEKPWTRPTMTALAWQLF